MNQNSVLALATYIYIYIYICVCVYNLVYVAKSIIFMWGTIAFSIHKCPTDDTSQYWKVICDVKCVCNKISICIVDTIIINAVFNHDNHLS